MINYYVDGITVELGNMVEARADMQNNLQVIIQGKVEVNTLELDPATISAILIALAEPLTERIEVFPPL